MDKAASNGLMVVISRAPSSRVSCTASVTTSGRMAESTKVNITTTRSMAMEPTPTLMEADILVSGKMVSSTVKAASSTLRTASPERVSGNMENSKSGYHRLLTILVSLLRNDYFIEM